MRILCVNNIISIFGFFYTWIIRIHCIKHLFFNVDYVLWIEPFTTIFSKCQFKDSRNEHFKPLVKFLLVFIIFIVTFIIHGVAVFIKFVIIIRQKWGIDVTPVNLRIFFVRYNAKRNGTKSCHGFISIHMYQKVCACFIFESVLQFLLYFFPMSFTRFFVQM